LTLNVALTTVLRTNVLHCDDPLSVCATRPQRSVRLPASRQHLLLTSEKASSSLDVCLLRSCDSVTCEIMAWLLQLCPRQPTSINPGTSKLQRVCQTGTASDTWLQPRHQRQLHCYHVASCSNSTSRSLILHHCPPRLTSQRYILTCKQH